MTFAKGNGVELRVLEGTEHEVRKWTDGVMSHLTTEHLFTGSFPMRYIDVKEQWEKERKAGDVLFGVWTYCDKEDKRAPAYLPYGGTEYGICLIGTCGLHSHREIYRSWEARFLIFDATAVGKGIGAEVVNLLTKYAFRKLNAHRVWLGVSADNLRAVKCYLSVGYKIEGTLKDELFYDGKYHDVYRMAMMENDEWKSIVR